MSGTPKSVAVRTRTVVAAMALATTAGVLGTGVESATAAPGGSSATQMRGQVVSLVNGIRVKHGCKPLAPAKRLNTAAQRHAVDMSVTSVFSHTSADGRSWVTRIRNAGWTRPAGENIARGFGSANSVVTAWMNSPDHRRNILNCQFRYVGTGFTAAGAYWVQDFGY